ncbi:MAG TPA: translation factor GTPase family protein [Candidatus Saccharimonadales bacterium]|nr:translation factor GTPase family protein [Candidatus Saccharimonadales bacterium]
MKILNLGILAHVDAGKTSLTERLLYTAGVIDEIGSVDAGNTQTDSLALERQRGITIKSAVASFVMHDTQINLLDTPGHPDFIAEVERVLHVLDGAVLVISAAEGVQAQTRILMRTLQRLGIPTIMFVNKIDRSGAEYERVLQEIADKLTPNITAMGTVSVIGTRGAGFVANPDAFTPELVVGTKAGKLHPVFFGSAITSAGTAEIMDGITKLLPTAEADARGETLGSIFKIERRANGEKVAYARMFSGAIQVRERLQFGTDKEGRITGIEAFAGGRVVKRTSLMAGEIGKLYGLSDGQIGDHIGSARSEQSHYFAPPTLETAITPVHASDKGKLHVALEQLAEQDPLINLRQDDVRQELYVSLYGEVQKEVIQDTLANEFGLDVTFNRTTTICVERPLDTGAAFAIGKRDSPFLATIGLRIQPGQHGSGVRYSVANEALGQMPAAFYKAVEDTVMQTLHQGLCGWEVTDCMITLTHADYFPRQSHAHARFDKSMSSTGADYRGLTPLVLMDALKAAGTAVCEPIHHFELEIPKSSLSAFLPVLAKLGAVPLNTLARGSVYVVQGDIPAARIHELQQELPGLTSGEGVLEYTFDRYEPVRGAVPVRPRTDFNPLDRKEYTQHITKRD